MVMTWVSLALLGWFLGVGSGWWPGPIGFMKLGISRMKDRRSSPVYEVADDEGDFVNPREPGDPPGFVRIAPPMWSQATGPRDLGDLRREYGLDQDDEGQDDDQDELPASRIEWVAQALADRARMAPDRRPLLTKIDEEGARLYHVTTRTLAADRAALAQRGQRGTMRGRR